MTLGGISVHGQGSDPSFISIPRSVRVRCATFRAGPEGARGRGCGVRLPALRTRGAAPACGVRRPGLRRTRSRPGHRHSGRQQPSNLADHHRGSPDANGATPVAAASVHRTVAEPRKRPSPRPSPPASGSRRSRPRRGWSSAGSATAAPGAQQGLPLRAPRLARTNAAAAGRKRARLHPLPLRGRSTGVTGTRRGCG